jgi:hypothetical protein
MDKVPQLAADKLEKLLRVMRTFCKIHIGLFELVTVGPNIIFVRNARPFDGELI